MKYAVVTGGTKGIGKAIVQKLLEDNYFVIINYSNDDTTASMVFNNFSSIYNSKLVLLKKDLSNTGNIEDFCNEILKITSTIDVFVFNAGKTDRDSFDSATIENWNSVFNTNLTVPTFIIQKLLNSFSQESVLLFTGSLMGIYPHSVSLSYGVSKTAVHALIKNLVKFLSHKKIRVNGIAPGFVETEWQLNKPEEIKRKIEKKIALNRFAHPEEIASACMFLVKNKYINGEILVIDGGYSFE